MGNLSKQDRTAAIVGRTRLAIMLRMTFIATVNWIAPAICLAQAPGTSIQISGTVRTASNQPLAGVAIAFTNGQTPITDGSGNYLAIVPPGFSGIATPSLSGYTFAPSNRSYTNIVSSQSGQDYSARPIGPATVTISGAIRTATAQAISGVTVTFSSGGPSATTDVTGSYTATVAAGYAGTAIPFRTGYTFNPPSRPYTNLLGNQGGEDYLGSPTVSAFTISGNIRTSSGVGIAGVAIAFSAGGPSVTTDSSGSYSAFVSGGYSGTATPSLSGYKFNPPSRSYANANANQNGQDYSGTPPAATYSVSGIVRALTGLGISGVTISFSNGGPSVTTASGGSYSAIVMAGYSGTAAPSLAGYLFNPQSRSYSNLSGNQGAEDYTGTPPAVGYTISGAVRSTSGLGVAGVSVTFSNGGPSVTTDFAGIYAAAIPSGYTGFATPSLGGYTFSPSSRSYTNVTGHQSGEDYAAAVAESYPVFSVGPIPADCAVPAVANQFSTISTARIYAWIPVQGSVGDSFHWDWYDPFQNLQLTANGTLGITGGGCAWSWIDVAGTDVAIRPGAWRVEYWQLETLRNSNKFQLVAPSASSAYVLSGTVRATSGQGIPGTTITLSNGGPSVVADGGGNYSATVSAGYTGIAIPSLSGYTFNPASRLYGAVNRNLDAQDYNGIAVVLSHPISGSVRNSVGQGIGAVTISFSNGGPSVITDSNGNYTATVPVGYNGIATPFLGGYVFDPASRSYANVSGNHSNENYAGRTSQVPGPSITAITNAASSIASPLAPGQLVAIYGFNLGTTTLTSLRIGGNGSVETSLAGTRVLFDGVPSPLLYARADQVGVIVPYAVAGKLSSRVVVEFLGIASAPLNIRVVDTAAGIFTINQQGTGQGAILNQNNSRNSALNPADKNSVVVLYATGEGQTTPSGIDGTITGATLRRPIAPVSVTMDGQTAEVLYAGSAPGLVAGVLQVNARVPQGITGGNSVPVTLRIGNDASQPGVTLAVR